MNNKTFEIIKEKSNKFNRKLRKFLRNNKFVISVFDFFYEEERKEIQGFYAKLQFTDILDDLTRKCSTSMAVLSSKPNYISFRRDIVKLNKLYFENKRFTINDYNTLRKLGQKRIVIKYGRN